MTRPQGVFVDAATGETVVRELTNEELEIHNATVEQNQKEATTE